LGLLEKIGFVSPNALDRIAAFAPGLGACGKNASWPIGRTRWAVEIWRVIDIILVRQAGGRPARANRAQDRRQPIG
jgi:hypothetical protein